MGTLRTKGTTWARQLGLLVVSLGVVVACGSADRPGAAGDGTVIPADGTCTTNGASRECHYTVPQPGMLVCGTGSQTCNNGSWSECAPGVGLNSYTLYPGYTWNPAAEVGKQLGINQLLNAATVVSTPPGTCAANPCDPNCQQVPLPIANLCGFVSEKPKDTYNDITGAGYPANPAVCVGVWPLADNCGYDSNCQADLKCHFNRDTTVSCTGGPDFTAGVACDNSGTTEVPICNRGDTDATSGTLKIAIKNATGSLSTCNRLTTGSTCSIDLSVTPIKKGQCINIDSTSCPAIASNTKYEFVVNDDGAGGARLPECNTCNNWGAFDSKSGNNRGCSLSCNEKDINGNDVNYNGLPGGFQLNPSPCNVGNTAGTSVAGTPVGYDPGASPPADNCNYDFQCVAGTCASFAKGDKNHCVGVDLTGGVGCVNHEGHIKFPICNRGSVAMPNTAITIGLASGTSGALSCTSGLGTAIDKGTCTINVDLAPGECKNLDTENCGSGFQDNGNRRVFIDTTNAVAECDECNNWSAYAQNDKCGQGGLAQTYDFQIPSSCPPGYIATWGKLFYAVNTPGGSKFLFQAQTGSAAAGPWSPASPVTVADSSVDGDICAIACPGPGQCNGPYAAPFTALWPPNKTDPVCPRDMTGPLGPDAKGQYLNLTIKLTQGKGDKQDQTPAMLAPPVVMFDCVPNE